MNLKQYFHTHRPHDLGSNSAWSTPFVGAPSSPSRGAPPGYFFSEPSSPIHFFMCSAAPSENNTKLDSSTPGDSEFEFSSRLSSSSSGPIGGVPMTSAEELFPNGLIKPMKLSSSSTHLQRPQILAPLLDLETEEEEALRDGGVNRRGRDLKLRSGTVQWSQEEEEVKECIRKLPEDYEDETKNNKTETAPSCSRSSSYGRNSKKWIFLKDLLHRSKSEGRGNGKEKLWSNVSFSPVNLKEKKLKSEDAAAVERQKQPPPAKRSPITGKPTNGIANRRGVQPSAHELHYTTNRAQAEEMKMRTYLPYRHGLFGCLGFSSKGYSAFNGLARSLNPVSSG
ncbi:uncharacterized protein LOC108852122 [Raphanus sativus]|uniref:Uncharacterized protein LOC108852122 n=1 Tax=Raphanus sativus TaxID=3726 RepID=A0A6J0NA83_RAPSA|nr:uncharacterized protein LOC108852122 [Raphanus sativus]